MKEVGVFRLAFPAASETFIINQAASLQRYRPLMVMKTKLRDSGIEGVAISDRDPHKWRQRAYMLSRSPSLFPDLGRLKKLAILHAHFGVDAAYALPLAARLHIPLIATFHGFDITSSRSSLLKSGQMHNYMYLLAADGLRERLTKVIAVSRFIASRLKEAGYDAGKIVQLHTGIDVHRFTPSKSVPTERYVLSVGRHVHTKGIGTLLRAFAMIAPRHPSVTLVQVGSGQLLEEHKRLARELGIEHQTRFTGELAHTQVLNLMQEAELFALTSETGRNGTQEALGLVFNEASACERAIVATASGGIPEAVLHAETGLLAREGDVKAIAENLDALLADAALRAALGRRGREYVCEGFDIRKQTPKLEAVYDSVIETWAG